MPLKELLNGFLKKPDKFFGIPEPTDGEPDIGVLGVPYDLTSSYAPGCRFAPDVIRQATTSERSHSQPSQIDNDRFVPRPLLSRVLTLEDIGNLEVDLRQPESAFYDISDAIYRLSSASSNFIFLGGDHFITYPILRGLKRGRPGEYGLIWFDAHADFYTDYGGYKLSHATTLRRITSEQLVRSPEIIAHDLRAALSDQRIELVGDKEVQVHSLESFRESLELVAQRVDRFYVSVDLDVLRPEVAPGVSHPESGGLAIEDLFQLLRECFKTGMVIAADIVELNPMLDRYGLTAIAARDLLKELLAGFATQKSV